MLFEFCFSCCANVPCFVTTFRCVHWRWQYCDVSIQYSKPSDDHSNCDSIWLIQKLNTIITEHHHSGSINVLIVCCWSCRRTNQNPRKKLIEVKETFTQNGNRKKWEKRKKTNGNEISLNWIDCLYGLAYHLCIPAKKVKQM